MIKRGPRHVIQFVVPGPILGYRASARRAFDPKYKAWKDAILLLAQAYGYPGRGRASPDYPPILHVTIRWGLKPKIDWSNVVKSIEDALWSDDRYVMPGKMEWRTGYAEEQVAVRIEMWK